MRTVSRAQHVVSTIICRYSRACRVAGDFAVKQGELFAGQALQPAHEPTRHIGTLPTSSGVAVAVRVFPSYGELDTGMLARVIVVARGRKSSGSFDARHGARRKTTAGMTGRSC
jgi:hypothetical protein